MPPGIHAATLAETLTRFGTGSAARQQQGQLLALVVQAALAYETIKRVLVWGSFVTDKPEPRDLDYSLVVSVEHRRTQITDLDRRFFVPHLARAHYGVDRSFLLLMDYPPVGYAEQIDFITTARDGTHPGIIEITLRGEVGGKHR